MANALKRDLKTGDKLVMLDGNSYEMTCQLFGACATTSGSAIAIRPLGSTEQGFKTSGHEIDPVKTMERHGKENGWV